MNITWIVYPNRPRLFRRSLKKHDEPIVNGVLTLSKCPKLWMLYPLLSKNMVFYDILTKLNYTKVPSQEYDSSCPFVFDAFCYLILPCDYRLSELIFLWVQYFCDFSFPSNVSPDAEYNSMFTCNEQHNV